MRGDFLLLTIVAALGMTLRFPFVGVLLWSWYALQTSARGSLWLCANGATQSGHRSGDNRSVAYIAGAQGSSRGTDLLASHPISGLDYN